MPGQVISLHAGQCGNQVGQEYWSKLASDHHILPDGTLQDKESKAPSLAYETNETKTTDLEPPKDHPELFFSATDSNRRYTPRAVLIDLEPSVINKSTTNMPMFSSRSIHVSPHGHGAANNWSQGYNYGNEKVEEIFDLIDRECDKCDTVGAFQLFHSVAGGTGAGVGSLLLEILADRHPKKIVPTFSVFPSSEKSSDVVVQPYNTVLTLKRLIEYASCTVVFDNDALTSIENNLFGFKDASVYAGANKLIAHVAATFSNPIRFPSFMYSSYESVLSSLVSTPELKFLTSSISPRVSKGQSEHDIMLELCGDKFKMHKIEDQTQFPSQLQHHQSSLKHLNILNFLPETSNQKELQRGILKAQSRLQFVPWATRSVHVALSGIADPTFAGVQLSNNTSIVSLFTRIVRQYDLLAKREAYLNYYTDDNTVESRQLMMETFRDAKDTILSTIDEYKNCQLETYLDDEF